MPTALPDTLAVRCLSLGLLIPKGRFHGVTAARLMDLPLPGAPDPQEPIHVEVPVGAPRVQIRGVNVHKAPGPIGPLVDNGRLQTVASALLWQSVAAMDGMDETSLVVLGDALARRDGGLGFINQVRAPSLVAARALTKIRYPVDSPPETRLRLALVAAGVPEPCVNQPAHDPAGGWLALPDLSWPEVLTALEYDGRHHAQPEQWVRDLRRRELLETAGWRVLVATAEDLRDPSGLVGRVAAVLAERGLRWRGCPVAGFSTTVGRPERTEQPGLVTDASSALELVVLQ